MKYIFSILILVFFTNSIWASFIYVPMSYDNQKNHLKAYGIVYFGLEAGLKSKWLLNYDGGAFLIENNKIIENEEKAPKIAVYSPKDKMPWDDAVTMVLTYAEIPFDVVYDQEGFSKVSQAKLAVSKKIRDYVIGGGFMFAMCSATDSFDIALSAEGVDIAEAMFDGDASEPNYQAKINFNKTFAFKNFQLIRNPTTYEFSTIDMTRKRKIPKTSDYFSLVEFSAKWDPIPTMLTQNHTTLVKGFMGQTTSFDRNTIKSNVLVLGENKTNSEARYIHGTKGKGMFTFYGGHDPEDYTHRVGDPKTELDLHPTSPGYRLILNNVLFPAAKKKKQKT